MVDGTAGSCCGGPRSLGGPAKLLVIDGGGPLFPTANGFCTIEGIGGLTATAIGALPIICLLWNGFLGAAATFGGIAFLVTGGCCRCVCPLCGVATVVVPSMRSDAFTGAQTCGPKRLFVAGGATPARTKFIAFFGSNLPGRIAGGGSARTIDGSALGTRFGGCSICSVAARRYIARRSATACSVGGGRGRGVSTAADGMAFAALDGAPSVVALANGLRGREERRSEAGAVVGVALDAVCFFDRCGLVSSGSSSSDVDGAQSETDGDMPGDWDRSCDEGGVLRLTVAVGRAVDRAVCRLSWLAANRGGGCDMLGCIRCAGGGVAVVLRL